MFTFADQLPLESISQLEAKGDPSNTIASELPAVPEASTTMYETGAATDDLTRALAIEAQVTDFLEEQPEEVMDDSEEERQMDTSITPCNFLPLSSLLLILSSVIRISKFVVLCVSSLFVIQLVKVLLRTL